MPARSGPKCDKCTYRKGRVLVHVAMKRIYIKYGKSWKAIGWICPMCHQVKLDVDADEYLRPYRGFFTKEIEEEEEYYR